MYMSIWDNIKTTKKMLAHLKQMFKHAYNMKF